MVVRFRHGRAEAAWSWGLRMVMGFDNCARNAGGTGEGIAVGECTFLPIDVWVDPFEPRHSQDHLVGTERSNEEGFLVINSTEGEVEDNDAVCMD
jgi:hypothetical protein